MRNAMWRILRPTLSMALLTMICLVMIGCGKKESKPEQQALNKVESAFLWASQEAKVPARMMLAAAYVESRLSPEKSVVTYDIPDAPTDAQKKKTVMLSNSAFNVPLAALGLQDNPDAGKLDVQVRSYAAWVKGELDKKDIHLPANPGSTDDKFHWIWELAALHRQTKAQKQNVSITFSKEMIAVLNDGFIWQDPTNGEILRFTKENPKIELKDMSAANQKTLEYSKGRGSDADAWAYYFPMTNVPDAKIENKPTHIEVIHCPLGLSACLEMQNQNSFSEVKLGAHYVIPQDGSQIDHALQLAKYDKPVVVTDSKGEAKVVTDAVVIMLVGNSGRVLEGSRNPALPNWFSNDQLELMGNIIGEVCGSLESEWQVSRDECMKIGGEKGVRFHYAKGKDGYRWGDIPDFDEAIFGSYLKNPDSQHDGVAFEFNGNNKEFKAGAIQLSLSFQPRAKLIEIERLVRCPADQRLIWVRLDMKDVRSIKKKTFEENIFDAGPNGNGNQFLRAMVYADGDELVGWAIEQIFLRDFEVPKKDAGDVPVKTVAPKGC